jgi:regulator of extracellular matrix RemA (YlzA/DUF370 family)
MFLHIGGNEVISARNIVGFFAIKQFLKSKDNLILYKELTAKNKVSKYTDKRSRSIILLKSGEYIESCISVSTLAKRLDTDKIINSLPKWSEI